MKLVFSRGAERDLRDVAAWIGQDDPDRAVTFVQELRDRCLVLLDFPLAGPPVEERPGTRKWLHRPYIIYYRPGRKVVTIKAIRHAARDAAAFS